MQSTTELLPVSGDDLARLIDELDKFPSDLNMMKLAAVTLAHLAERERYTEERIEEIAAHARDGWENAHYWEARARLAPIENPMVIDVDRGAAIDVLRDIGLAYDGLAERIAARQEDNHPVVQAMMKHRCG